MSSTNVCRDDAFACIRRIGVDTGGSNIQFAVNPENGDVVVIEMNPRVSRSSALASKATGFPIAKIAARLAVGYRLDEIINDITGETPASFEPTIDYVVTKIPRWAFEKLPGASPVLGTMMQSVGEVMAIGRTFPESLQKALRSLETGRYGLNCDPTEREYDAHSDDELVRMVATATPERPFLLDAALRRGVSVERLHETTGIDPWFLQHLAALGDLRAELAGRTPAELTRREWRRVKRAGFSDAQLAYLWNVDEAVVYAARRRRRRGDHLQDGRHVRRGVRGGDALSLRHLRGRGRGRAAHPAGGGDPRQRPEPHRSGGRVRLLLRARRVRALRRRLRDGHAQLQPRDRLHRLRHQRPPVLRTALRGRRPRGVPPPAGARRGRGSTRRRGGGARRPDAAQARPDAGGRRHPGARHESRLDRPGRRPRAVPRALHPARHRATSRWDGRRPRRRRAPSPTSSGTRCWSGRRTCSAGGPCRSSTTSPASTPRWRSWPRPGASVARVGCRPSDRCWSTGSSRTRWRSTSTPSATRTATS